MNKFTHNIPFNMYIRQQTKVLKQLLREKPHKIIMITGPRQVGKTTMVNQTLKSFDSSTFTFYSTDRPPENNNIFKENFENLSSQQIYSSQVTSTWIIEKWQLERSKAKKLSQDKYQILIIDEIQKIPNWSQVVKGLWDQDRQNNVAMHVVLLGSSPVALQRGTTESLMGRFENIHMTHWSYGEMSKAFDFSLEEYIYFGGYPGSADLIKDQKRWRSYVQNSLITPSIEKDMLSVTRVDKPHLLKNLFEIGCIYSGQIMSYNKLLGGISIECHIQTLSHYLDLLSQYSLLTGLQKFRSSKKLWVRSSSPKLIANNTAFISALSSYDFNQAKQDRTYWGHLVESTIGSYLVNYKTNQMKLYYWRDKTNEVDFVLQKGDQLLAIEVKSGKRLHAHKGLESFLSCYQNSRQLFINRDSIVELLSKPLEELFG